MSCCRLRSDWQLANGYQPALLAAFVESARFTGASYRAVHWLQVGKTKGRGKPDCYNEYALPMKDVYRCPLHRAYGSILASPE